MTDDTEPKAPASRPAPPGTAPAADTPEAPKPLPREIGGRAGPEPTRYGDWEKNGIVSDF